jgi:hypothetical protein
MIDSVGCGLGGFGAEPSRIANKLAACVISISTTATRALALATRATQLLRCCRLPK